jgi:hypothetical protein
MKQLVEVSINEELNEALVAANPLERALKEYLKLKAIVEDCQERMRAVRIPIEEALALCGEPMEIADFTCTLLPCERESFNLKEARKHIKEDVLKPYLSTSRYTQLRIQGKK